MPEEFEVSYGKAKIVAKGLLSVKLVFIGGFTAWYLYNILPNLRTQIQLATTVYMLGVIVFVAVFFGSWRLTFRRTRKAGRKQKKVIGSRSLEEWMREQK